MPLDIAIGRNQDARTGRWNFERTTSGDVAFDETQAHAVITSSLEYQGEYWADQSHGSTLHRIRTITSRTPSDAEQRERQALGPLERASLIVVGDVTGAADRRAARLSLDVNWTTPGGAVASATIAI